MCIERVFGVLKKRFRVLDVEPFWSYETQVDVVLACCVIHNYLRGVDPNDAITQEADLEVETHDIRKSLTRKEIREETKELMVIALLEFLVEEVRKGHRPIHTFRTSSFIAAAKMISEKFHTTCTADHVKNHMRTVRTTWGVISQVRGRSGFGWDDNVKMYLNKKIDMYDEISIVAGKDIARGNFSKTFGDIQTNSSGQPSTIEFEPTKLDSATSLEPRYHKKRSRAEEEEDDLRHIST
uniref:Myb/SANT-like domain-containing protein n=1 Tax=Chenopodium quinoa TaxID=63459 RepID=A0A803NF15_CHEQI